MLSSYIKVISIVILLSACSLQAPKADLDKTEPVAEPVLITITDNYANELITGNDKELQTEFNSPHSCLMTDATPTQTEPNWLAPATIWQRIRIGFSLDHYVKNKRLDAELNWYKKNPAYMARVSERSKRYIFHVVEQLEKSNMPTELALLPIVESAYDPFAYSHGRASGMWQFIPSTGRQYKLKQDWWYDGRRDIIDSTQAAISYLQMLNKIYKGDWLLALAAYNSGQGTVNKAIRKNVKRGKATDFWSLDLPRETQSYVPKLLALAQIVDSPIRHGISLFTVDNAPYFAQVDTQSQIDLAQAAQMAKIEIDELYRLNPGFNRWATTPSGPHRLLVPLTNEQPFNQALIDYPASDRLLWQRYTIKNGDALNILAKRFKTDVDTIRQINGLRGNRIRAGKSLMIPIASKSKSHYSLSKDERLAKIQKNRTGGKNSTQIFHHVKSGESLWTIARKHQVTVAKIAHWNEVGYRDVLRVGQKLSIWVSNKSTTSVDKNLAHIGQRDKMMKKVGYKVRNGDSLARIADRFNLRIKEIVQWNSINPKKYLQPGQRLTLYIDIMNAVN